VGVGEVAEVGEGMGGPTELEASHRRALVVSEIAAEGVMALSRVLRRAARGDGAAADIPVVLLLRAVPVLRTADSADLLTRARIPQSCVAGDLAPGQRVALLELVGLAQSASRATS